MNNLDEMVRKDAEAIMPLQPDEFTVYDYAKLMKSHGVNLGPTAARDALFRKIANGELTQRKTIVGGKLTSVFRITSQPPSKK